MFARHRSQFIPIAGLVSAVIGFTYSLLMSVGVAQETFCLNSGCAIVQDFRVFGISPWWAASVFFALIAILCFVRFRRAARILAMFFLAGDCLFLLLMLFIAPCSSCLIGAVIIFSCWVSLRTNAYSLIVARRIMAGALSAVWLILFMLNLGYAANEAVPTWKIVESSAEGNKISIYFSPSCPACREAVKLFAGRASFYPVAERQDDYPVIADLYNRTKNGIPLSKALDAIITEQKSNTYTAPEESFWRSMFNKIRIMRNQSSAMHYGNSLPIIIFEGLPASWVETSGAASAGEIVAPDTPDDNSEQTLPVPEEQPSENPADNLGSPDLPFGLSHDFNSTLDCERGKEEPCDEAESLIGQ